RELLLRGRVLDTDGAPLDGGLVELRRRSEEEVEKGGRGSTVIFETRSDRDGRFVVRGVDPAAGDLLCAQDEDGLARAEVTVGATADGVVSVGPYRLRLEEARLLFVVQDAEGERVPGVTVRARCLDSEKELDSPQNLLVATSASDGTGVLKGFRFNRNYIVGTKSDDYYTWSKLGRVDRGQEPQPLMLTVYRRAVYRGRVLLPDGTPAAQCLLAIRPSITGEPAIRTNSQGAFEFRTRGRDGAVSLLGLSACQSFFVDFTCDALGDGEELARLDLFARDCGSFEVRFQGLLPPPDAPRLSVELPMPKETRDKWRPVLEACIESAGPQHGGPYSSSQGAAGAGWARLAGLSRPNERLIYRAEEASVLRVPIFWSGEV
ncbi:MAG: hypothetical protein AAF368_17910, partial [Planctomycetota bacterium]